MLIFGRGFNHFKYIYFFPTIRLDRHWIKWKNDRELGIKHWDLTFYFLHFYITLMKR
jgi:hypothetical protein